MNQRFDPNDSRPVNPATWPSEQASQRIDPTTGTPVTDPLNERAAAEQRQRDININNAATDARESRSMWPLLIVLIAGVVLALLFWLPGEQAGDNTATPPASEQTTTTPPADNNATTPPADNNATAPATPSTGTTPQATTPDTTGTGTQPAPATGTNQQPATGTTPQATEPAPQQ